MCCRTNYVNNAMHVKILSRCTDDVIIAECVDKYFAILVRHIILKKRISQIKDQFDVVNYAMSSWDPKLKEK